LLWIYCGFIGAAEYMTVKKNISYMIFVQAVNYVVPLLVLPIIARVYSISEFGELAIFMGFTMLFQIILSFGLGLYGTKEVAESHDTNQINEHLSIYVTIQIVAIVLMFFPVYIAADYASDSVSLSSFGVIVSFFSGAISALFPVWFFQGRERFRLLSLLVSSSKIVYLLLVLTLAYMEFELSYIFIAYLISNSFLLIFSVFVLKHERYSFAKPKYNMVKTTFLKLIPFYLSRLSTSVYGSASTIVLASVAGVLSVANYSTAEKVYNAGISALSPVSQVLFPYIIKTRNIKMLFKIVFFVVFVGGVGLFFIAPYFGDIIAFVFGESYRSAAEVLKILSLALIVNFVSTNFGYPAHAYINKINFVNYTVYIGAGIQVVFLSLLYYNSILDEYSLAYSIFIVEITIAFIRMLSFTFGYRGCNDNHHC
jgi:O-antigen/teichoic acid export membrane protein